MIASNIYVKGNDADITQVASLLPELLCIVRDCDLEVTVDGKASTEDDYLRNALKLKTGLVCFD